MMSGATSISRVERSARLFHSTCQFTCGQRPHGRALIAWLHSKKPFWG
jgi:hypothetical protein